MCNIIQNFNLIQWFGQQKADFSNACRNFSGERGPQMFGRTFLEGWDKFYYWQGPEVWGNFSKICFRIIKNMKNCWENLREIQSSRKFSFFELAMGKIRIIIYVGYNGGRFVGPRSYKILNNFFKKLNLLNLRNFRKFGENFPQVCSKTIK